MRDLGETLPGDDIQYFLCVDGRLTQQFPMIRVICDPLPTGGKGQCQGRILMTTQSTI
jgi:hypothetical protein